MATASTGQRCWSAAAVERLSVRCGPSRLRQLHWVLGELHRHTPSSTTSSTTSDAVSDNVRGGSGSANAAAVPEVREHLDEACPCWEILAGVGALSYLDAADTGALRARPRSIGDPRSSSSSRRVRISILRALVAELTQLPGAPDLGSQPALRPGPPPPPPSTDPDLIGRFLTALRHDTTPRGLRTAAAAHLAAGGVRVGEMLALRTDQISWDGRVLYDVTRAPRGPAGRYQLASLPLSAATAATVRSWLEARDHHAAARVAHLFCSLSATSVDGSLRPAGLPATARTLDRSHRQAIDTWLLATNPSLPAPSRLAIADLTLTRLADRAHTPPPPPPGQLAHPTANPTAHPTADTTARHRPSTGEQAHP